MQICPVGALTATPYRFRARPWDLSAVETSCTTCSVHCRGALESSSNQLVRLLGVDSEPVNQGWLCDKGRFGYEVVHSEERIRQPMVRKDGELVECSWPEALDAAADGLQRALDLNGPHSVALLGGARGTNEDAYAWARFAKGVLGTDNVDAQLGDGLPVEVALGLPDATIAGARHRGRDRGGRARPQGGGPRPLPPREAGGGRSRRAAHRARAPGPGSDAATRAHHSARSRASRTSWPAAWSPRSAGSVAHDTEVARAAALLDGREGNVVVVIGRGDVAESADAHGARRGGRSRRCPTPDSSSRCGAATCAARSTSASPRASSRVA